MASKHWDAMGWDGMGVEQVLAHTGGTFDRANPDMGQDFLAHWTAKAAGTR